MFNLSPTLAQIKDRILKRPVEIHDLYLGSQTSEDDLTLHFVNYYHQINFFSYLNKAAQSYQPLAVSRSGMKRTSHGEVDRVNYKIDNVTKAMTDYAAATDFRNKRIVSRLIFRDHLDSADDAKVVFDGIIQSILFDQASVNVTAVPIISSLSFITGWPYQLKCNNKFADSYCKVNKNDPVNRCSGIATGGSSSSLIDTTFLIQASGYWNIGEITMTSGNNNGARRKIIGFDQASATLFFDFEMNYDVQAGDTYNVFRGCDKSLTMCQNTYNNDANFHGFHTIPLNESNT